MADQSRSSEVLSKTGFSHIDPLSGFTFASDWAAGAPTAVAHLPPFDEQIFQALRAQSAKPFVPWSSEEVQELAKFNKSIGNDVGAEMAAALGDSDILAVVTGQQPNLLASPLYILHKALSAQAHARGIASTSGRRVIPIFWVASDDHDFQELRQAWVLGADGSISNAGQRLSRGDAPDDSPAYEWNLASQTDALLEDLRGAAGTTAAVDKMSSFVEGIFSSGTGFEEIFCRTLSLLLGPKHPILFVTPRLGSFRSRQIPVLLADLDRAPAVAKIINAAGSTMENDGYPTSLRREVGLLNCFYLQDRKRMRLTKKGEKIEVRNPRDKSLIRAFTEAEFAKELENYPERFSPNVVTRPLLQDSALPCVLYVAGPGEIAYLAQIRVAYAEYRIISSAVTLRSLITLLPPEQVVAREDANVPMAESQEAVSYLTELQKLEQSFQSGLLQMEHQSASANPHVQIALKKTQRSIQRSLDRLKSRLARQLNSKAWDRMSWSNSLVAPAGQAQERILSPLNFIDADHPAAFADWLVDAVDYTSALPQTATLPKQFSEAGAER